ncbi:cytochrome P450 [Actinoplanes sp. NPDC051513]|uniref:cytochrome P450 n=1 Tax=Actinoplanes sp. NPDC051513 TaxID=3363908 RepID=UPI0037ABF25A
MTATARARDRRVYLLSHPVLFALLAALRGKPVRRLGRTLVVHDREAYLAALTRIPLDRTAEGTTGGAVDRLAGAGGLFDQQGDQHRQARRDVAERLGAAGVERLRPVWTRLLDERLAPLAEGGAVDLAPLAAEIAGATAAALLGLDADPFELAAAAQEAGATAARAHLPGLGRRRAAAQAERAAERLLALVTPAGTAACPVVGEGGPPARGDSRAGHGDGSASRGDGGPAVERGRGDAGLAATLAVAAVNTTVAALPRAAAWVCDGGLWAYAREGVLVDELLRVTSPTPLLPRVAAAGGEIADGCPVRAGDRMLLIARHAVDAHRRDPDPVNPAPARISQLVFGAGTHACPGARLARRQLGDLLEALAPHRPVVVRAGVDRRAALPSWRTLIVRATA